MSAADFLDDSFPHGTVDGFRGGCRTNRLCATADSWLSCAAVNTRYASDWVFRKRVDAGATVAELIAFDAADIEAARVARRRVREAEASARHRKSKRKHGTPRNSSASHHVWTPAQVERLRELHALGWADSRIGADPIIGRNHQSVWLKRKSLKLPANRRTSNTVHRDAPHGNIHGYFRGGCRDDDSCPASPTCGEKGREYLRERRRKAKETTP